jgi:hypothetical protein
MGAVEQGTAAKDGLRGYYRAKIEEFELAVRDKTSNLRRLEAQRNELNQKGTHASNPSPMTLGNGSLLRSERGRIRGTPGCLRIRDRAPARASEKRCHEATRANESRRTGHAPREDRTPASRHGSLDALQTHF